MKILGILFLIYPFLVFFGLQHLEPRWLGLCLLVLVCARLIFGSKLVSKAPWPYLAPIFTVAVLLSAVIANAELGVLLYPLAINLAMLLVFACSLIIKPSVIEMLARISEPDLDAHAVRYTEKVTMVWCLFFIANGSISLYTALYSTKEVWTLYNGMIAYIAMGVLFAIEWLVRQYVKRKKALE